MRLDTPVFLEEVTPLQFLNEVVGTKFPIGREACNDGSQIIIPWTVFGSPPNDREIPMRSQDSAKQRKNDLPLHPVQALPRSDESIGRPEGHFLYASIHPVQMRMIAI